MTFFVHRPQDLERIIRRLKKAFQLHIQYDLRLWERSPALGERTREKHTRALRRFRRRKVKRIESQV